MRDIAGKVAVVTGGASGIGFALASRFVADGAKVVIADVQGDALSRAVAALEAEGGEVGGLQVDLRHAAETDRLADFAYEQFGAVHILCNNAGVSVLGPLFEQTTDDWQWTLEVNLWAVLHGIRSFVPRMLADGEPGHVLNTASIGAFFASPVASAYSVSKYAVLGLSESLAHELAAREAPIGVTVLCPHIVRTNILASARNRPPELAQSAAFGADALAAFEAATAAQGTSPEDAADAAVEAMRAGRFLAFTAPEAAEHILQRRAEDLLAHRLPRLPKSPLR